MTEHVSGDRFAQLFTDFTTYAFRYECQAEYRESFEAEPWRKFRDGEPDDLAWIRPWLDGVRAATAAGRRFERVRVLTDPLTDYLEWEMYIGQFNAQAGEHIRVLDEQQRTALALPGDDFWLFDDTLVARMLYDEDLSFVGAELVSDHDAVHTALHIREIAWQKSTPFVEDPRFSKA